MLSSDPQKRAGVDMGILGGESLPCPAPTMCSWHCGGCKLHPQGLAAPGDWHRAPSTVPSAPTLPPAIVGGAQPLLAPSLPTQHQCGWPGVGRFSQFHPRIHTCLLTHLSLLCKWKIAPEQDVGPLLGVTTRCGTVALLAVHTGVPVRP